MSVYEGAPKTLFLVDERNHSLELYLITDKLISQGPKHPSYLVQASVKRVLVLAAVLSRSA